MKRYQAAIPAIFALALNLVSPALAQIATTPIGTMKATIDETEYVGETLAVPSEGTATAEFRSFGPVTTISIQAHDPQADSAMRNVLAIDVSLMGSEGAASIMDVSVSWWPDGMGEPFYLSEDSGTVPEIVFDALSLEDTGARAQGRFSAAVCRRDAIFAEADTSDCRLVEGVFETALRNAD